MIRCPQCQAEMAEGKRFCPQCGARLPEPSANTVRLPSEGDAGKTMVVPPAPAGEAGRTVLLPPEGDAGQPATPPPASAAESGKTVAIPPAPAGEAGRTVLLPPEGDAGKLATPPPASAADAGKTIMVPPAPPAAPSSSAGGQTIPSHPPQPSQAPAAGGSSSLPQPSSGGGFGLPPSPPPTSPASSGGLGLPPSPPPASGSGFGLPSSAPSPAAGSSVAPPTATRSAKKGTNWLLIIGIILGVLVLGCLLTLGGLYIISQQAAQSLGTAVSGTVVSVESPPGTTNFPNVLLRDSLASEDRSQFTAGRTDSGDYRFENGAFVIESLEADQVVWQMVDIAVDDGSFEIEATVSNPRSAAAALLFRYQDEQNFYILSIDGRGRYRVARLVDDNFSILQDWKSSPAINAAGSSNRLKVEMVGDSLTFYCNGQRLASLRDSAFRSGDLAFGTETFDEGPGIVRFTNLLVRGR